MDLHDLFPMFGIKNHLFRLNFSRKHLTNLFFVYATLMTYSTNAGQNHHNLHHYKHLLLVNTLSIISNYYSSQLFTEGYLVEYSNHTRKILW